MPNPVASPLTVSGTISENRSGRVVALDALRGLAVIGIVPMNVLVYSMPSAAYVNPRAWGGTGPVEIAAWALVFLVIEDKFRNLFAMMFGAGVAILMARTQNHPLTSHLARMTALFAIGFVHATLLANNDILRLYALSGLILPLFLRFQPKTLLVLAGLLVAGQLAITGYFSWGWLEYWWRLHSGAMSEFGPLAGAEAAFGADPNALAASVERGTETFSQRLARRLTNFEGPLRTAVAGIPSTLAAMFVGVALWRNGLLAGEWPLAKALRLGRWAMFISLPLLAMLVWWSIWSGFSAVVTAANALVWSAPFDLLLAIGWAALAMPLFAKFDHQAWLQRLAATGRMALTNYVATSVVFAAIYANWGLGLFGQVGRVVALASCAVPIGLMLLWSPWWLVRFRQGPLEWLWRSVAGGKMLPLRR